MQKFKNLFFLLCTLHTAHMSGVTIVYNLRVAGIARREALTQQFQNRFIAAANAFGQFRQHYNGATERTGGILGTFVTLPRPWYFKIDAAVGNVRECILGTSFSRTQADDILFSGGYIASPNDRTRLAFSGLLGIPTHKNFGLQAIQFGTGHVGVGAQIDGSYIYSPKKVHAIISAIRIVHFFPRNASVNVLNNCLTYNVHLGNVLDLYISHQSSWNHHTLELGYNPGFAFGAFTTPRIQAVEDNAHAIRNSFFGNYRYGFLVKGNMSALLLGISAGFDKRTTDVGIRKGATLWLGWGINF